MCFLCFSHIFSLSLPPLSLFSLCSDSCIVYSQTPPLLSLSSSLTQGYFLFFFRCLRIPWSLGLRNRRRSRDRSARSPLHSQKRSRWCYKTLWRWHQRSLNGQYTAGSLEELQELQGFCWWLQMFKLFIEITWKLLCSLLVNLNFTSQCEDCLLEL